MSEIGEQLRQLPAVDQVLQARALREAGPHYPRSLVVEAIRHSLDQLRQRILGGQEVAARETEPEAVAQRSLRYLEETFSLHFRPVINATGVVLHTNLGRAPLSQAAQEAVQRIAVGYSNLEMDLETGERGSRYVHVEAWLSRLTGAEASLVVNNNAAAVLLALTALARGREVIVSRGELVEIGGSFRVPEVMAQSGATLVEVGTTNKTYARDYEKAITDNTALLLKVHPSNFRVQGFTQEASLAELVELGRTYHLPVMMDLGSGLMLPLAQGRHQGEPIVPEVVAQGPDLVTFSGDKLLGGPQAGIILGRKEVIGRLRQHPLTRALRIDKLTLAALEATLREYLDEKRAAVTIPTLRMLNASEAELRDRAEKLLRLVQAALSRTAAATAEVPAKGEPRGKTSELGLSVIRVSSRAGGGSLPVTDFPSFAVAVSLGPAGDAEKMAQALRRRQPPVIGRIQDRALILDARTLADHELPEVARAVAEAWRTIQALSPRVEFKQGREGGCKR